ncbi:head-tail adaptor protein [Candidatus Halocynthiibacter alkanivorans]|uniref:head-tail adaptor protein n=1 Tax=Candidatus Halocynthiibacter alkanivorans TaxID=2267619 RepID=UPI000DF297FB|nr:head-tail adaptor protein [Candidatus Halocynthiibacter alkanivorans]
MKTKVVHLNRKLVLEQRQRVADGAGGFTELWQPLGMLWGAIHAGAGRARAEDTVSVSSVPYRITVRASEEGAVSRPQPDQRLREGGRIFSIYAVADHPENAHYLICHTRQEVVT